MTSEDYPAARINPRIIPDARLRSEWEHFAGFGWPDRKIAARLGLDWDTVIKWKSRAAHPEQIAS